MARESASGIIIGTGESRLSFRPRKGESTEPLSYLRAFIGLEIGERQLGFVSRIVEEWEVSTLVFTLKTLENWNHTPNFTFIFTEGWNIAENFSLHVMENWETDSIIVTSQFTETWEIDTLIVTSKIVETWELITFTVGSAEIEENWEVGVFSFNLQFTEGWNDFPAIIEEEWEFPPAGSATSEHLEGWELPDAGTATSEYFEDWESSEPVFNITLSEMWELPPEPSFGESPNFVFYETWEEVGIASNNLAVWLDAEILGDSAIGLSNGDPVSTWFDSGLNGNDFTQTGSARPEFVTNVLNGLPVVRFNGTSQYMSTTDSADFTSSDGEFSFFAVIKTTYNNSRQIILRSRNNATAGTASGFSVELDENGDFEGAVAAPTHAEDTSGNFVGFTQSEIDLINAGYVLIVLTFDNTNSTARLNSVDFSTTDTELSGSSPIGTVDGETPHLGRAVNASIRFFFGDIAELLYYTRLLNSTEISNVENYLISKYNLIPDEIPTNNLAMWLEADAIVGLNNGDPVTTWSDSGPNGNDFSQSGSSRPEYVTNVVNSLPVVRFDGSATYLNATDNSDFTSSAGYTYFCVLSVNASTTAQVLLRSRNNGAFGTESGFSFELDASGDFDATTAAFEDTSGDFRTYDAPTTNLEGAGFVVLTILFTGYFVQVRIDGSNISTTTGGDTPPIATVDGESPHIGRSVNGAERWFDGDMAEVMLYSKALNKGEITFIESYLMSKYSL